VDVESVFGNIKGNLRFTRFLLRGLHKVRTEFGIVAMAHNILKWAANSQTNFKNKETERMEKLIVFSIRSVFMDFLDKPSFFEQKSIFYNVILIYFCCAKSSVIAGIV